MIVDTSALVALLQNEAEAERFVKLMDEADSCAMSVAALLEASMIAQSRRGDAGVHELDALIDQFDVEIIPFTVEQAHIARRAFRKFGKGRHAANLNFGDCISYALARDMAEPLLFKGDDFRHTDIEAAYPPKE